MATCRDCFHCNACHEMWLISVSQEDDFFEKNDADTCEDFINKADVEEVKHGEWFLLDDGSGTCTLCGKHQKHVWDMDNWQNFCGNCGAKMDGGKAE